MGEEEGEPKTAEFERVAASNMESRLSAVKHSSVVSSSSFEFETGLVSLVLAQLPEESGASLRLERRAPRRRRARFGSELLRVVPCCCCCCCWLGSWGRVMVFANGGCCCWCWCCAGDEEGALALLLLWLSQEHLGMLQLQALVVHRAVAVEALRFDIMAMKEKEREEREGGGGGEVVLAGWMEGRDWKMKHTVWTCGFDALREVQCWVRTGGTKDRGNTAAQKGGMQIEEECSVSRVGVNKRHARKRRGGGGLQ